MTAIVIFIVFMTFTFFMVVVFRAKKLKAKKGANAGADSYCCGKCGACDKDLPPS